MSKPNPHNPSKQALANVAVKAELRRLNDEVEELHECDTNHENRIRKLEDDGITNKNTMESMNRTLGRMEEASKLRDDEFKKTLTDFQKNYVDKVDSMKSEFVPKAVLEAQKSADQREGKFQKLVWAVVGGISVGVGIPFVLLIVGAIVKLFQSMQ